MGRVKKRIKENHERHNKTYRIAFREFKRRIHILEVRYGQKDFAKRFGVDPRTVRKWKTGERVISKKNYQRLNRWYNRLKNKVKEEYGRLYSFEIEYEYTKFDWIMVMERTERQVKKRLEKFRSSINIVDDDLVLIKNINDKYFETHIYPLFIDAMETTNENAIAGSYNNMLTLIMNLRNKIDVNKWKRQADIIYKNKMMELEI